MPMCVRACVGACVHLQLARFIESIASGQACSEDGWPWHFCVCVCALKYELECVARYNGQHNQRL